MRTSFHHQPEAQHPNFPLSASGQADYPISWHGAAVSECPLFGVALETTSPALGPPARTFGTAKIMPLMGLH
jgi:hypothetical protein